MNLLMISGDRSMLSQKKGAFYYTLEEFRTHWERIDIICPRSTHQISPEDGIAAFDNVFFHPNPRGIFSQPRWIVRKGQNLISSHHHDVMTVHEYPPFFNGIGAERLHAKTNIPYALEIHHVVGYPRAGSVLEYIGRIFSRAYMRHDAAHAKAIRCVSQGTADVLSGWGVPQKKIHIVPSFYLDADVLTPNSSIEKKYDCVFCARLVANKGVREFLVAIRTIPDISVLIIGDGPLKSSLQKQAKTMGISHRVQFAGWMNDKEQVYTALQSGTIFVMNSTSEGGPRVALEAMALGIPVISTRVGVMPDVIEDGVNGVFSKGDSQDLAEKITMLLQDSELRVRIGTQGKAVLTRFERKILIQGYADFLKTLV